MSIAHTFTHIFHMSTQCMIAMQLCIALHRSSNHSHSFDFAPNQINDVNSSSAQRQQLTVSSSITWHQHRLCIPSIINYSSLECICIIYSCSFKHSVVHRIALHRRNIADTVASTCTDHCRFLLCTSILHITHNVASKRQRHRHWQRSRSSSHSSFIISICAITDRSKSECRSDDSMACITICLRFTDSATAGRPCRKHVNRRISASFETRQSQRQRVGRSIRAGTPALSLSCACSHACAASFLRARHRRRQRGRHEDWHADAAAPNAHTATLAHSCISESCCNDARRTPLASAESLPCFHNYSTQSLAASLAPLDSRTRASRRRFQCTESRHHAPSVYNGVECIDGRTQSEHDSRAAGVSARKREVSSTQHTCVK